MNSKGERRYFPYPRVTMQFLYLESQRMPIKHRVGTPTGFLGCHSSWYRGTDPPRPPAQPARVPSCCFWPHRGKARDVPGLLTLPAIGTSPQQGPSEPHVQMNRVDSAPPGPSEAMLRRADRAGPRPSSGDSRRSPGVPPGNRVFTVPRVTCHLPERKGKCSRSVVSDSLRSHRL